MSRGQPLIPPSLTVTMKRVAAELGVSVTTISKVLNNHADIGEATRQRVLAKVDEMGYRRNAVARSLTLKRTHTLGVIVSDLLNSFFVEVVSAIEASLGRQGYGLLLCNLGEDPAKERCCSRCCSSGRSTGSSSRRPTRSATATCSAISRRRARDWCSSTATITRACAAIAS